MSCIFCGGDHSENACPKKPSGSFSQASPKEFAKQLMKEVTGIDPAKDQCAMCGKTVDPNSFRDILSKKEWLITQTCMACQDIVFAPPPDDEE